MDKISLTYYLQEQLKQKIFVESYYYLEKYDMLTINYLAPNNRSFYTFVVGGFKDSYMPPYFPWEKIYLRKEKINKIKHIKEKSI